MELVRSEPIKVRIYGQDFNLKKPEFGVALKIQKDLQNAKEDGARLELMQDFVVGCGMPLEFVAQMELEHVVALMEFLTPKKKE